MDANQILGHASGHAVVERQASRTGWRVRGGSGFTVRLTDITHSRVSCTLRVTFKTGCVKRYPCVSWKVGAAERCRPEDCHLGGLFLGSSYLASHWVLQGTGPQWGSHSSLQTVQDLRTEKASWGKCQVIELKEKQNSQSPGQTLF